LSAPCDSNCIELIDDVDLLSIRPTPDSSPIDYFVQTVLVVLEGDDILYLRKTFDGYASFNKDNKKFEPLHDVTLQQTSLASKWIIFAYETNDTVFSLSDLRKVSIDETILDSRIEPDDAAMDVVQGLLPTFIRPFDVGLVRLNKEDISRLCNKDGLLNDMIINAYLHIIASAPASNRIFAVSSYFVSKILRKMIDSIKCSWLSYDIILCPINDNNHWYIIIFNMKEKLIVQLDSLSKHQISRSENLIRLASYLNTQFILKTGNTMDYDGPWKLANPTDEKAFQQTDASSCGIHLLIQTASYVQKKKFAIINDENIQCYRYQIAETILRRAELVSDDSNDSVSVVDQKYLYFMERSFTDT
jgi:hypothetical protein